MKTNTLQILTYSSAAVAVLALMGLGGQHYLHTKEVRGIQAANVKKVNEVMMGLSRDFDSSKCGDDGVTCLFTQTAIPYEALKITLSNLPVEQDVTYRVFFEVKLVTRHSAITRPNQQGVLNCNGAHQFFYACQEITSENPAGVILPLSKGFDGLEGNTRFDVKVMAVAQASRTDFKVKKKDEPPVSDLAPGAQDAAVKPESGTNVGSTPVEGGDMGDKEQATEPPPTSLITN